MTILQVPICQNDNSQNANPAKMTILQMSIGPMTILQMPIVLNDNCSKKFEVAKLVNRWRQGK
jgi:hypothetical protein